MKVDIIKGLERTKTGYRWRQIKTPCEITIKVDETQLYTFTIVNMIERRLFIKSLFGEIIEIDRGNFISGHISKLISKKEELQINQKIKTTQGEAVYLGRENQKYKFICIKCSNIFYKVSAQISNYYKNGTVTGCPYCSSQKVKEGFNDLATTHPHLIRYFKDMEKAKSVSSGSSLQIKTLCPKCHREGEMIVNNLVNRGFSCQFCGKKVSYPERFFISFLNHLNIDYIFQPGVKYFDWASNYKYDFYLKDYDTIVEIHGGFHYRDTSFSKCEEVQLNDKLKYELAKNNGIKNYIVINCDSQKVSDFKNNILNSELKEIVFNKDFVKLNWNEIIKKSKCDDVFDKIIDGYKETHNLKEIVQATGFSYFIVKKNLDLVGRKNPRFCAKLKEDKIQKLWNEGLREISLFMKELKMSRSGIIRILKRLEKNGKINYNKKELVKRLKPKTKKVKCLNDQKEFESLTKCSEYYNLSPKNVSRWIRGERKCCQKHANGNTYKFIYLDN